ncbi:MAG: hypothetical protein Q7I97_00760 [Thermovirgaceae bacterium]|nr:hypothetical protein [Thermovirgaceae bacterium]
MKRSILIVAVFLIAALSFGYMSFARQVDVLTMTPEAEIAIAEMGNDVTLSAVPIPSSWGDATVAVVRGGAPDDTGKYRLVEGHGILLWVDRALRFRGRSIDLDIGFVSEGMVVYATNFTPVP